MTDPVKESPIEAQTIALAGLLQAVYLVDQIARTGSASQESMATSIHSLFAFSPGTTREVFGGIYGVKLGLQILQDILSGNKAGEYPAVSRYVLAVIHLEKKLSRNQEMLSIIHNRLQHSSVKLEHFSSNINDINHSVAAIYQDTLSTLNYRIQISGSMQQLQNSTNADNIRALLFAAVRAAMLWRQLGGRRWQFFLRRKQIIHTARSLLSY